MEQAQQAKGVEVYGEVPLVHSPSESIEPLPFILSRAKASSKAFLLVRERRFDITKINPFVQSILAKVRYISFRAESDRVGIHAIKLKQLLGGDLKDQCPTLHAVVP